MAKCIVCGKLIAKRTHQFVFRQPREALVGKSIGFGIPDMEAIPDGTFNRGHSYSEIFLTECPTTVEELARWTNHTVIRFSRDSRGAINRFSTWDGESYKDPWFHSETCAAMQGRASAHSGDRYTWKA